MDGVSGSARAVEGVRCMERGVGKSCMEMKGRGVSESVYYYIVPIKLLGYVDKSRFL